MKYNQAVIIGRFQPFHNGHQQLLGVAQSLAPKVKVLIGSPNKPRDIKNPFTAQERSHMIEPLLRADDTVHYIEDSIYNDQTWAASVQSTVDAEGITNTVIVGFHKDDSSYYLDMFPQYYYHEASVVEQIDATSIREKLFYDINNYDVALRMVPRPVAKFLSNFRQNCSDIYSNLIFEWKFIVDYKSQFESMPYPPTFVTVDAVVVCKGHVLMVRRKAYPGKGLMAFPGGFAKIDKTLKTSVLEELSEETKIKIPEKVLKNSIEATEVFDAPGRSLRGRTITHAFLFDLKESKRLPYVIGSDDADKAFWIPLSQFYRSAEELFEDHFHMGLKMIGKIGSNI